MSKLLHLHNAAHFQCFSPVLLLNAVRSHYEIYNAGVNPPSVGTHCNNCGIVAIPGLSCSLRVQYRHTGKKRSRLLVKTCLVCSHVLVQKGLLNEKRVRENKPSEGKKKKKKRNDLSAMLQQKKLQSEPGLGLFDFI